MSEYTGRKIAILTDAHGLLEPVEAVLKDIKNRGINEIYSLGDNIGDGPSPCEVINLLEEYGVRSIAGNAEEYIILGIEPFSSYMHGSRIASTEWTKSKLDKETLNFIKNYRHSYILELGGKKIGLCHFANDVRIDFDKRSTWSYQENFDYLGTGKRYYDDASKQFEYTNSIEQQSEILHRLSKLSFKNDSLGYMSAYNEPLFQTELGSHKGLLVSDFDYIFQGHVHFKLYDDNGITRFSTLRAVGMAYRNDPIDSASYIILKERQLGFDCEEILVEFDREKMVYNILSSNGPEYRINLFTGITNEEKNNYYKTK